MILFKARRIAEDVLQQLQPHCIEGYCNIAGSVRREKEDVGDIELVIVPKRIITTKNLFGEQTQELIQQFINTFNQWEKIAGDPTGRQTKRKYPTGDGDFIQLDIYMPQTEDYFRQYAIRTGSAAYSAKVIAAGWVKQGFRGTEEGLRKEKECIKKGEKWICVANNPEKPPIFDNEKEFFDFLQIPYLPPNKRNL